MTAIQIVWFKRDLRVVDHRPLHAAARTGKPVLPLYIVEPAWWGEPDMAGRHWAFIADSLAELRTDLAALGAPLVVRTGDAISVLADIHDRHGIDAIWSHEETGGAWTYARDRRVGAWCQTTGIPWRELPQHGIVRRLDSRNGWARHWDRFMAEPVAPYPERMVPVLGLDPGPIPTDADLRLAADPCPGRQPGGAGAAQTLLDSFLDTRGQGYQREMSSPISAESACSRLSPHLAWGTLSMRMAAQATWSRMREIRGLPSKDKGRWPGSLRAFIGRLHWHCHFMQKLESEPELETQVLHPAYNGLRELNTETHTAWADGNTGLPFLDACMRSLNATGWINFRMRAMLMCVSSYHLWNHWREPGLHLARQFTDYEPGIHWSQTQMQSGTTGINSTRVYNPVKQGYDQDSDGSFVRRWVPELAAVPTSHIHEPWRLSPLERQDLGIHYPDPLIDPVAAARVARSRIWAVRRGPEYRAAADAIQERHGSRKSGLPPSNPAKRRRDDARQTRLEV